MDDDEESGLIGSVSAVSVIRDHPAAVGMERHGWHAMRQPLTRRTYRQLDSGHIHGPNSKCTIWSNTASGWVAADGETKN